MPLQLHRLLLVADVWQAGQPQGHLRHQPLPPPALALALAALASAAAAVAAPPLSPTVL